MEIRQLIAFQKVAELSSFSRAAEVLGYSQSNVTVQIKALETEFDTKLFDRFGKKVAITPSGREVLQRANRILAEVNRLEEDMGKGLAAPHVLHVGTLDSLCAFVMPEILKVLYEVHPEYHIKITRSSPDSLIDMMEHNEVDLIYILDAPRYDIRWQRVLEQVEQVVFVCAANSRLQKEKEISLEDLVRQPFFLTEAKDNYRYALSQCLAERNLSIDPILEVGDTELIARLVAEHQACSFLPYFAAKYHQEKGELSILDVENFRLEMTHQIIYDKNKYVTKEMMEFIRIADPVIRKLQK